MSSSPLPTKHPSPPVIPSQTNRGHLVDTPFSSNDTSIRVACNGVPDRVSPPPPTALNNSAILSPTRARSKLHSTHSRPPACGHARTRPYRAKRRILRCWPQPVPSSFRTHTRIRLCQHHTQKSRGRELDPCTVTALMTSPAPLGDSPPGRGTWNPRSELTFVSVGDGTSQVEPAHAPFPPPAAGPLSLRR